MLQLYANCAEGLHFSAFIIIVHTIKNQSVVNKCMQKAGEPESDTGFLKVIIITAFQNV